jgi:hypothetical protein
MIVDPRPIAIKIEAYSNIVYFGFSFGSPKTTCPYLENEKNKPATTIKTAYHKYPQVNISTILLKMPFNKAMDLASFIENGILIPRIINTDGIKIL